ncbi:MAG TPA: hypothetical protein VF531_02420 [Bacillota bacterium]
MKQIRIALATKYWLGIFAVSGGIFVWGLTSWIVARFYQPSMPVQTQVGKYSYRLPETDHQGRTDSLPGDRLFFGGAVSQNPVPAETGISFHSSLILWGTIAGETAVVGLDPNSNTATQLVRVGEVFAGEKIITIGSNYIVVKNQTGTGRVNL